MDADFIDMKDIPFVPIASGQGNARFTGVFDGNGVTIKNLSIDSSQIKMRFYDLINGYPTDRQNIGLFGVIGTGGVVKNVILENVSIKATGKIHIGTQVYLRLVWVPLRAGLQTEK